MTRPRIDWRGQRSPEVGGGGGRAGATGEGAGAKGEGGAGRGVYRTLRCHHQTDFCIKMESDERRYNASFIVRGKKSQDGVHKPQPFRRERRTEAESNRGLSAYQPNALPLGRIGSHSRINKRGS